MTTSIVKLCIMDNWTCCSFFFLIINFINNNIGTCWNLLPPDIYFTSRSLILACRDAKNRLEVMFWSKPLILRLTAIELPVVEVALNIQGNWKKISIFTKLEIRFLKCLNYLVSSFFALHRLGGGRLRRNIYFVWAGRPLP